MVPESQCLSKAERVGTALEADGEPSAEQHESPGELAADPEDLSAQIGRNPATQEDQDAAPGSIGRHGLPGHAFHRADQLSKAEPSRGIPGGPVTNGQDQPRLDEAE